MSASSEQKLELWEAIVNGDKDKVMSLLKNTERPGEIRYSYNRTLLHYAAMYGMTDLCQLLVEQYQVDPHVKDNGWWTALYEACARNHTDTVKYLVSHAHCDPLIENKYGRTPLSYSSGETEYFLQDIIEKSKKRGFSSIPEYTRSRAMRTEEQPLESHSDLSTKVSPISPSIHYPDYGISIDIDPASLHPTSHTVANIQVYNEDKSQEQSNLLKHHEPASATYRVSIDGDHPSTRNTSSSMVLKIMHSADPDSKEQLDQLTFVKSSDDSLSQFEIVPGGKFKRGSQYGEINVPQDSSSWWRIIWKFIKFGTRGPPLYRGVILYTRQSLPSLWVMQLFVSRNEHMIALNEYIRNEYGSRHRDRESDFYFKFNEMKKLKMKINEEMNEKNFTIKCRNGWTIALEVYEISQETADIFKQSHDVPGRCELQIDTAGQHNHGESHERKEELALEEQPIVELRGIDSDRKHIRVHPPIGGDDEGHKRLAEPLKKINSSELTVDQVFHCIQDHSADWDRIGRELGVSPKHRNDLRTNMILTAEGRLKGVIHTWIESETSPVTWDHLLSVLQRLGYKRTRKIIENAVKDCLPSQQNKGRAEDDSTTYSQQVIMNINNGAQVQLNAPLNNQSINNSNNSLAGLRSRQKQTSSGNNNIPNPSTLPKWLITNTRDGPKLLMSVMFMLVMLCVIVFYTK